MKVKKSAYVPVESGVPKELVLGPSPFLVLYKTIFQWSNISHTTICKRHYVIYGYKIHYRSRQTCTMGRKRNMAFCPDKYNVLSATRKKNPIKFKNTLHGHPLGSMEQAIYLGLTIGKDMK
jgi:hypothetical protein